MRLLTRRPPGGVFHFAMPRADFRAAARALAGVPAAVAFALAAVCSAQAAGLQVTPISLEVRAEEQGQALFLSNTGKTALRAQVRVQQWTQQAGQDQLAPTRDVVASPPAVEIAPGGRQMVRIVRLLPAPAAVEKTYRLLIDELPPSASSAPSSAAPGLQFLLRYSVPVFVLPPAAANIGSGANTALPPGAAAPTNVSQLLASVKQDGPRATVLTISNRGARRAKLSKLAFVSADGQRSLLYPGLMGYVLAGQTMEWPLALPMQSLQSGGSLKAKFNDDPEEQTLPLASDHS